MGKGGWWRGGEARALAWALCAVVAIALAAAFVSPLGRVDDAGTDQSQAEADPEQGEPQPADPSQDQQDDDQPDEAGDDSPDDAGMQDVDPSETPGDGALDARLDAYLDASLPQAHVPGVAVAVVDTSGTLYERAMGDMTSVSAPVLVGSLSKSFTAVCIMQLVERGLVDLDAPASRYLQDPESLPDAVTVRDLLNQTSGLGYYDSLAQATARTAPGDTYGSFSYANANYDLLGRIVEDVSGQNYSDYLAANVLEPLGMTRSSGDQYGQLVDGSSTAAELAPGHRNWFGAYLADGFEHARGDEAWGSAPSGYVASSLGDLETYLRMYLAAGAVPGSDDGSRVLDPASVSAMFLDRVPDPDSGTFYGMGWTSFYWDDGELVLSHDGSVEGCCARMVLLPERGLGIVLVCDGSDEVAGSSLFFEMADGVVQTVAGDVPDPLDGSWYLDEHASDDGFYLACVTACLASLLLVRYWRVYLRRIGVRRLGWRGIGLRHQMGVCVRLAAYPVLAAIVLTRPLAWGVPWRDLWTFVPDVSAVLVLCVVLLLAAGVRRVAILLRVTRG